MIKQNKCRKTYNKDFKLEAVKMRIEQGYSIEGVLQAMDIPDRRMIQRWVKKYLTYGEIGLEEHRGKASIGRPRKSPLTQDEEISRHIQRLEMENEILKKLLKVQGRDVPLR